MNIEEIAFKDRTELAHLNEIDLLNIIEFLQKDRKQWINQFSETHNESVEIQARNRKLKDSWNKLKEWASNFYNSEEVGWAGCGIRYTLEKMQELEQGSDNDVKD